MSFWTKTNKKGPEPEALSPLPACDQAKLITPEEARNSDLPLGWYLFRENISWYGLKPNGSHTGHLWSDPAQSPEALEEWLGTAVPEAALEAERNSRTTLEESVRRAKEALRAQQQAEQMPQEPKADPIRKRTHRLSLRMNDREFIDFMF